MSSVAASISVDAIPRSRRARVTFALVGNPNAGKSTLFNRLTGLRQKTANYPGVTVEKHIGTALLDATPLDLIDLPGIFSLTPDSADERIAVEVLLGRVAGTPQPDGILAVVDATRLYQGLYLLQQLAEIGRPMIVVLTMADAAARLGTRFDIEKLSARLGGIPVVPVVATTGKGLVDLKRELTVAMTAETSPPPSFWPALRQTAVQLLGGANTDSCGTGIQEVERNLVEEDPLATARLVALKGPGVVTQIEKARGELFRGEPGLAVEARHRYGWIRGVLDEVQSAAPPIARWGSFVVDWMNRPYPATVLFFVVMALVFQAVFAWATPFMDLIDAATSGLGESIRQYLPDGVLQSLVVDGVIAGVGSVIIFLPQILILFLFIILLEDTGYLARAAFLVDRAMRPVGLSGQSVIPLLSSFACAVPGIMATRAIPDRRDRIATILAAPFLTCSARLPVYALLIAAFVPSRTIGVANLQGIVLFGLYMLGIVGGIGTALLLRRSALRGPKPNFVLALPAFRLPNLRTVAIALLDRVKVFLRRAGTVIFMVAVIVWALAYFPRSATVEADAAAARAVAEANYSGVELTQQLADVDNKAAAAHLEQSALGRVGKIVEPVFTPLGWDWKISAAVIAGFPAREVVVAVLGTIYAVGAEADESSLADRLRSATFADGSQVFTLPMVLGLLVFYAWCLQCVATLAVIRRETNSWRWPVFAWAYMTVLGYLGALLIYQVGSRIAA